VDELPNNAKGWEVGRQPIRAATSIGANLSEADHALTDADFAYKASVARREAAETAFRLERIVGARTIHHKRVAELHREADELIRILTTLVKRTPSHIERMMQGRKTGSTCARREGPQQRSM